MQTALLILFVFLPGFLLPAQAIAQHSTSLHATPRLVAEQMVAKPGQTLWLALDFAIEEGWHTYWPGLNDTGFALEAEVEVTQQAEAGALVWPAPHRLATAEGILDHVFADRMTVLLPVTIREDAHQGERVTVRVSMRWLVCASACVMESADRSIDIPISDAIGKPAPETAEVFARARARLPDPLTEADPIALTLEGRVLTVTRNDAQRLAFYPTEGSRRPRDLLTEGHAEGDTLTIAFREGDAPIAGVLEVWTGPETSSLHTIRWPPRPAPESEPTRPAPRRGPPQD